MSEFERWIKDLWARLTAGASTSAKTAGQRRGDSTGNLRREASARAQQAAAKARDLRDSDTAKKTASALHDLREGEAAKKAEAAINDLRSSDAGRKAEAAIADLRQREPVKRAEESARKVLHDLFSGDGTGSSNTPTS